MSVVFATPLICRTLLMAMTQRLLGRDMAARAFELLLRSLAKALMTLTTFSAFSVALFVTLKLYECAIATRTKPAARLLDAQAD